MTFSWDYRTLEGRSAIESYLECGSALKESGLSLLKIEGDAVFVEATSGNKTSIDKLGVITEACWQNTLGSRQCLASRRRLQEGKASFVSSKMKRLENGKPCKLTYNATYEIYSLKSLGRFTWASMSSRVTRRPYGPYVL